MKSFMKKIYSRLPFKHLLFDVVRKFYLPPDDLLKHLYFDGHFFDVFLKGGTKFRMLANGTVLENQVFWKGIPAGWEPMSMSIWQLLAKQSQVIFDIGANTGIFSMVAKSLNPEADVHCFEPIPKVYSQLTKNIHENSYDIQANQLAISNYDGTGNFWDDTNNHLLSVTLNKTVDFYADHYRKKVETDVMRLDSYMRGRNVKRVDLIKIDAEYHDAEVLQSLGSFLDQQPNILIEVLNEEVALKINQYIEGLNYRIISIDEEIGFTLKRVVEKSPSFNVLLLNESGFKKFEAEINVRGKDKTTVHS